MLHGYTPHHRFLPYLSWIDIDALVDSVIAAGVVGRALSILANDVPAYSLPPITYGKSDEHLHFPGTITVTGDLVQNTVIEIGESIYRAGFRKLLIVNAHGGQPQPLDMAARELRLRHGDFVLIARSAWAVPHDESFMSDQERHLAMHAGHGETALMLALAPDTVRMDRAHANVLEPFPCPTLSTTRPAAAWCARDFGPSGVIGDPTGATREQGLALLDQLGTSWATAIGEVHRMRWPERQAATWGRSQFHGDIQSHRP
jgi:creatinine amidohydrolase